MKKAERGDEGENLTRALRQLDECQRVPDALKPFPSPGIDPEDAATAAKAIREVETTIDARLSPLRENPWTPVLATRVKESYRRGVAERLARRAWLRAGTPKGNA